MKKNSAPATLKPASSLPEKPAEQIKVTRPVASKEKTSTPLFDKDNYKWMVAGLVVIAVGFTLMAGGKSSNSTVFQDNEVYSFTRITVAPILIIAGFIIEIIAIMRRPANAFKQ